MNPSTIERQQLIEIINALPNEALSELASFVDYLRYKSTKHIEVENSSSDFLLSIAGLGTSAENDLSERDEEILRNEVDPVRGWSLKPDNLA
ncbi:hypothetical protein [Brasilonema sp. UFV-L1]|uniref:hypothetical protein n=1 Tax=Brasilonema sp. UFV-L1 TaxID=2234130 RepID=UPI00145E588D|nr:hypothetical protein [Brasilonema sp. UFV-L1]NMG08905.1 hypothetical protein [Brasilonema sp. UFV-L1]